MLNPLFDPIQSAVMPTGENAVETSYRQSGELSKQC